MYRFDLSTPNVGAPTTTRGGVGSGRRSTRSARGSTKRRRSDQGASGGLKSRFAKAAERPATKWVQISRPPAPHISFQVLTWVPWENLTDQERQDYETQQQQRQQEQQAQDQHAVEAESLPILEAPMDLEAGEVTTATTVASTTETPANLLATPVAGSSDKASPAGSEQPSILISVEPTVNRASGDDSAANQESNTADITATPAPHDAGNIQPAIVTTTDETTDQVAPEQGDVAEPSAKRMRVEEPENLSIAPSMVSTLLPYPALDDDMKEVNASENSERLDTSLAQKADMPLMNSVSKADEVASEPH